MKADRSVQVVRDGREQTVSIFDVVVGDIFIVKAGELLPCDGLLLRGSGLKCDESAMTGESLEVPKSVGGEGHSGPYLTAGAQVTAGAGSMLVLTVGPHTSFGKIITDLEDAEPPPTPLQEKLETLAKMIGLVGVAGGVLIFLVLLIAYLIHAKGNYHGAFGSILSYFIIGITIIVVAVPEGLPLAVMIALAYSMRQMIKDKVLVRELNACETMGSVTTICSDKTGTLTENRMTVIKAWVGGVSYFDALPNAEQVGGAPRVDELARSIALNSDAMVTYEAQEHGGRKIVVAGNKSEGALLHFLGSSLSVDFDALRAKFGHPLFRENFSSARKRMTSVFRDGASGDLNVYCKGASEMVLALCSNFRVADGTTLPLDAARRAELLNVIEALAAQGLRTFAVAIRRLPAAAAPCADDAAVEALQSAWEKVLETDVERELTLLLVAGIADPVRAAVPGAVASCKAAGIKVRMVTGDNLVTAKYIAAQCGIMMGGECIEGRAWREMTDAQRADLAPRLDVMARAVPQDKLLLVEALKALGQTVAVTGDGTNDAPALRAAHVGCAMGIAGTEVAKEAGKMIILDDNFASIVTAVVWGRSVLENIRKFLVFQLTINLVAGLLTFAMAIEISTHEPSAAAKESGGWCPAPAGPSASPLAGPLASPARRLRSLARPLTPLAPPFLSPRDAGRREARVPAHRRAAAVDQPAHGLLRGAHAGDRAAGPGAHVHAAAGQDARAHDSHDVQEHCRARGLPARAAAGPLADDVGDEPLRAARSRARPPHPLLLHLQHLRLPAALQPLQQPPHPRP